jgi:c(7)-type cytochrome triheme protein
MRLPPAILFDQSKDSPAPVPFSHATHVEHAKGRCLACHPEPYKMLHPLRRATHEEMDAGRSCGACHEGKTAFATTDGDRCDRCHGAEVRP